MGLTTDARRVWDQPRSVNRRTSQFELCDGAMHRTLGQSGSQLASPWMRDMTPLLGRSAFLFLCLVTALAPAAEAQSGAEARAAARSHREANEPRILREF